MSKSRKLEPILRGAVTLVMASGVTAGCGGVEAGIEGDPGFTTPSCEAREHDVLSGLRPEPPADYLELRSRSPGGGFDTIASWGEPCEGAEDEATCLTALAEAPATEGFGLWRCWQGCEPHYLTISTGDTVRVLDTQEEVAGFLGTIDTPEEAMLIVGMERFDVRCGDGGAKPDGSGFLVQGFTYPGCDGVTRHLLGVAADGSISERERAVLKEADSNCVVGRRPQGLAPLMRRRAARPLARYLAEAARLEAASVHAFRRLERELSAHGAPRRLLAAARRAAADEVRHARMTAKLARRFGAKRLEGAHVAPQATRELESVLRENTIEGCVRETFGTAVGVWQARTARDPAVAQTMRHIAADELRHAALAWQIARWFEPKLDSGTRRRLREAQRAAIAELRVELERPTDATLQRTLGVPSASSALRLHRQLELRVWT